MFEHVVYPVGCRSEEDDKGGREGEDKDPRFPKHGTPTDPKIDPSGYAYEAVASNRVEGVSATVWYLGADGTEHEWTEAAEYNEVNPQTTGEDGCYSWYTPMGKWKVKLEKDGYLSADSTGDPAAVDGWLPVPPPQLDVNIAMVSTRSPEVDEASAGDGEIVLEFSQYMDVAALDAHPERVTVTQNGDAVDVTATFSDVEESEYYYKAVLWAAENGITQGTGDGRFSPEVVVSRSQSVTFLFRAIGRKVGGATRFTDVAAGEYYYDAVLWAVANGVSQGTGATTFSPEDACLRAQIVTFLYRAYHRQ